MRFHLVVRLLILVALAAGCGRKSEAQGPEARRAFYFWRTTFALSPAEQQAIAALPPCLREVVA